MTRRNGNRRGRRSRNRQGRGVPSDQYWLTSKMSERPVRIPFSFMLTQTTSSTTTILSAALDPNAGIFGSTRVAAVAALFNMYRFTKLKITMFPFTFTSLDELVALGYLPGVITTAAPTTANAVYNLPVSCALSASDLAATGIDVPRKVLVGQGQMKWWKCSNATDSAEENQGQIYAIGTVASSASYFFAVEGICEFSGPVISGESVAAAKSIPDDYSDIADEKEARRVNPPPDRLSIMNQRFQRSAERATEATARLPQPRATSPVPSEAGAPPERSTKFRDLPLLKR